MGFTRTACVALLSLLSFAETNAADTVDDESSSVALSTVQVTAGRHAEAQVDVPQPVTVMSREQIDRQAPRTWTDLLRGQPGVFNQSSGPGQGIVILRGLTGSEVLHLVDGIRLNNAFFRNAPTQYIALVDPYNIERLELVRGPSSALYGSDALGGVVQLITPEERFASEQFSARGSALAQYGSADLSRSGRIDAAVGREDFSVAGGFTFRDVGEQISADGDRLANTDYLFRAWDMKLLWSPAADQELMLAASHSEVPNLARYHVIVPGFAAAPDSDFNFFQPNARSFFHARYDRALDTSFADSLQLHLARQIVRDHRFSQEFQGVQTQRDAQRSTLDGFTAQLDKQLGAHFLSYGIDFYHDRVDSARTRTSLVTGESAVALSSFPDGAESDDLGAYIHDEWLPAADWLLDTGLRLNYARTELPAADRGTGTEVEDVDLTGNLGIRYRITAGLSWNANVGRGFRAPNVFDLGTLGARPSNRFNVPNPNLEPETVHSIDTGFKWHDPVLSGEIFVFYSRYDDRIVSVATGNIRPDGRTEVQSRNIASATYRGIETGLRYHASPGWEAYVTVNYTRGEETTGDDTTPANRVPPVNGRVGGLVRPGPNWYVESFLLFADRQDRLAPQDVDDSRIDPNGTPGWVSLNARLGWMPTPRYRIGLDANNLFDQNYREHGSGIDAPGRGLALTLETLFL
ncbi:TonB-dependent receptor [soil metagenome]